MDASTLFAQYDADRSVGYYKRILLSANRSSTVYGNSNIVQPNAIRAYYIIKF